MHQNFGVTKLLRELSFKTLFSSKYGFGLAQKSISTILAIHWIKFIWYQPNIYFILNCIRDQWEFEYEWTSRAAQRAITRYGTGPYWVTVDPLYPGHLPPWLLAALYAGEPQPGNPGEPRFPRFLLGHEWFQRIAEIVEPGYVDIRVRARDQVAQYSTKQWKKVRRLIRQYRAPFNHVFPEEAQD